MFMSSSSSPPNSGLGSGCGGGAGAYSSLGTSNACRGRIRLNPVAPLIRAWQKLFLDGHLDPLLVAAAYLSGFVCLAVGSLMYRALSPRFGELV